MIDPARTTAPGWFGDIVDTYDSLMRRAVPRYEEMTERLIDYLPPTATRILELGCGTGNLTLRLARRFPQAQLTTVDAAPEMIEVTRARLAEASPSSGARTLFVTLRFEEMEFPAASFDLVTSCISLHHVHDKGPLYRGVHAWLAAGGTFRFADQLLGGSKANHELNWRRWLEFCRRPGSCTEDEVKSLLDHAAAHDHYTPIWEHFRLLVAAGFSDTALDCVWRNLIWGIVTADR